MVKKLDKLLIKAFIGPFIATFFITLLVLVMQFFWLYIDDFVGKGLSAGVILEFIWYQSAVLVPLALPLSVLLSSLMTFGNLGESFELVAIKSAGISLLRFMRPLFIVTFLICVVAFLFSNYIMPVANLKSRTLLGDIYYAKPAFDLKEGVFYDKIEGFAIKVGKKENNDSVIRNVIIFEKGGPLQDNFITAQSGVMRITDNRRYLEMRLHDGWWYQEKGQRGEKNSDFIRIKFSEYTKQFDLSSLQFNRTADSVNKNNERMRNMKQLQYVIDSLKRRINNFQQTAISKEFENLPFSKYLDSAQWRVQVSALKQGNRFEDLIPDSALKEVNRESANRVTNLKVNNEVALSEYKSVRKDLIQHEIEWHRKISLSLACLVLFMIGAPLGSIIRKGGLGSPLIFAIIFFMVFYFTSTTGEKFAKESSLTPLVGMWLSSIVLVPIGVFLIYKAMRDSQLFNKEFYYRLLKKFRKED